jgi:predicted regulator of Ras-like GTPase activity (Roadblock/LC7/MglB family)
MQSSSQRFSTDVTQAAYENLENFVTSNPGVVLAVLTSGDGFEITAYPQHRQLAPRIAAMSSSMQALAEAMSREAGLANTRSLIVESDAGTILVLGLADATVRVSLAVVASGDATLGQLLWATRNCGTLLARSLQL